MNSETHGLVDMHSVNAQWHTHMAHTYRGNALKYAHMGMHRGNALRCTHRMLGHTQRQTSDHARYMH